MSIKTKKSVTGIQKYFILGALMLSVTLMFWFMSSFLSTLLIAAIFVTAVFPIRNTLLQRSKLPKSLIAAITFILIIVLILIPLLFFFFAIANQASDAYLAISESINKLSQSDFELIPLRSDVNAWITKYLGDFSISTKEIMTTAGDFIGSISTFLLKNATNAIKSVSVFLIHIIVFLLAMYYFLRDGDRIIDYVSSSLPLKKDYCDQLFKKMYNLMHSIIFGIFGAAIAQGVLLGLGFALAGISNAAFWGALGALLSPLPYIGTAVVWVPAVITLYVTGHWVLATILMLWCILIVGLADNMVKPYIIGSASNLHPFAVMLVILGGAFTFGFKGLIFGPFVLTITLSFLHIYHIEFGGMLQPLKRQKLELPIIGFIKKKK